MEPLEFVTFHKKITKPFCTFIWIFIIVLNLLITLFLRQDVSGSNEFARHTLIYIRCHLGVTLPVVGSILINIYLIIFLKQKDKAPEISEFKKLINGLVVWMIVCNGPFIAWLHYTLQFERSISWTGTGGVRWDMIKNLVTITQGFFSYHVCFRYKLFQNIFFSWCLQLSQDYFSNSTQALIQ